MQKLIMIGNDEGDGVFSNFISDLQQFIGSFYEFVFLYGFHPKHHFWRV
jgi:hypothetical protein